MLELRDLKDEKDRLDEVLKELSARYESEKKDAINILKAHKREAYSLEGAVSVDIRSKEVYRVPQTNADKTKLFNYIKEKQGPDALMSMVSIHSATLTTWANEESSQGVMSIPGLEAPTMTETLYVRRKK